MQFMPPGRDLPTAQLNELNEVMGDTCLDSFPSELSTPLSRFDAKYPGDALKPQDPQALAVYEARLEVGRERIMSPYTIVADGHVVAVCGGTGWKYREPSLEVVRSLPEFDDQIGGEKKEEKEKEEKKGEEEDDDDDYWGNTEVTTGFWEPGAVLCADPAHNLVWMKADERVKAFIADKKRGLPWLPEEAHGQDPSEHTRKKKRKGRRNDGEKEKYTDGV